MTRLLRLAAIALALIAGFVARAGDASAAGAVRPCLFCEIVAGRRAISADTDLRLCRFFGLSEGFWLRGQARFDTEIAKDALAAQLAKIKPWQGAAAA